MRNQFVPRILLLMTFVIGGGCGSDAQPTGNVESRSDFATADGLLDHINTLIGRTPIDQERLDSLYYPENELQRRLTGINRAIRPFERMQHEVFERFGAGLNDAVTASPIAPMPQATITERADRRAVAATTFADGSPLTLYLVKVGDRWWISGYTFERAFDSPEQARMFADTMENTDRLVERSRSFMERIQRDEFATIEELRTAWKSHLSSGH